jgi:hypothetical protein
MLAQVNDRFAKLIFSSVTPNFGCMISPKAKKIILTIVCLWVIAFALSRFADYWMRENTPAFLADMQDNLAKKPRMVSRLGEDARYTSTYNEHDLEKDTLPYTFSLRAGKGSLKIEGYAIKQQGQWVPVKADTVFTINE